MLLIFLQKTKIISKSFYLPSVKFKDQLVPDISFDNLNDIEIYQFIKFINKSYKGLKRKHYLRTEAITERERRD